MKVGMLVGYHVGGRLGGSASLNWSVAAAWRHERWESNFTDFPFRETLISFQHVVIFFNARQPTASKQSRASQVPLSYRQQFCRLKRRRPTLVLYLPEPLAPSLLITQGLIPVSPKRAQDVTHNTYTCYFVYGASGSRGRSFLCFLIIWSSHARRGGSFHLLVTETFTYLKGKASF